MLYDQNGIFTGESLEGENERLEHYGTPRHSGRYPWGSGDNPYQRNADFIGRVDKLRKEGVSEKDIAKSMGMNTSDLRKAKALALAENRAYLSAEAKRLKAKGMSTSAIARRMGRNESSIRGLLDEGINERMSAPERNAILLKERVEKLNYIDVGKGSEQYLGLSAHSLGNTLHKLEQEGYMIHDIPVEQLGTGKMTTVKVLTKPGVEWKEVYNNRANIKMVKDVYSEDGGETIRPIKEYVSVDPKRIQIKYAEDGGADKEGVVELRRGVDDISLGKSRYAQVRILVDGTHYIKGMAMYSDDLPPGCDMLVNTNKAKGTPMMVKGDPEAKQVLKPIKADLENPFGANIMPDEKLTRAQSHYIGKDGKEHQSAINIVSEEGTWNGWNRTLASQFLSKQSPALAKQQLKMAYDIAKSEFDEIASYTNPTVKAKMLEDFAGRCETDSVHLQAAALPRQSTRVILPLTNTKDTEIYCPGNYKDGEQVALVRYPHAGHFEIPVLTVNNNNKLAKSTIGDAIDAVGISKKVADRLSGADFDGDTVLVLPVSNVKIKATANNRPTAYKDLEDYDPKKLYPEYPGMHRMTPHEKGIEMGKITNLITDMTFQGATDREICRAVKHSMTVIDAEKHHLDYKRSEQENGIAELKAKYQTGGASTLLSRSTSDILIPERREKSFGKMTPEEQKRYLNGEMIYRETGKTRKFGDAMVSRMTKDEKVMWKSGDPELQRQVRAAMYNDGRIRVREEPVTIKSTRGAEEPTYSLVSGGSREKTTQTERIYADHAVAMKDLARQARALARQQVDIKRDPQAAKEYAAEVESLNNKLSVALRNAPLERQAQLLANSKMDTILYNNPTLKNDKEHYKREKGRQLEYARKAVGAKKLSIGGSDKNPLTDREWLAIQKGAVSPSVLKRILLNADMRRVKELAMPRSRTGMPAAKVARAKDMIAKGYSRADICDMLDVSESSLITAIGIENL